MKSRTFSNLLDNRLAKIQIHVDDIDHCTHNVSVVNLRPKILGIIPKGHVRDIIPTQINVAIRKNTK